MNSTAAHSEKPNVETIPRPFCPVCTSEGSFIYHNLKDRLFNNPGEWNMKKCNNAACRMFWLDPTPKEEDIPKLYENYSTHDDAPFVPINTHTPLRRLFERVRQRYLHTHYGYEADSHSFTDTALGLLAYLHPAWKDSQAANIFYLPNHPRGTLLDVGCGNGTSMQKMKSMGWNVVGTDFDEKAVKNAQSKGLEVYHGDISSQHFMPETFDAIMMNHVIEHVPHPIALLKECRELLKNDGHLSIITPNAASRGSAHFGRNWRALETPHHLQVFTVQSLALLAKEAGFSEIKSFSSLQGAQYILGASANLKQGKPSDKPEAYTLFNRIKKQAVWFVLGWIHVLLPGRDEVAVIVCRK